MSVLPAHASAPADSPLIDRARRARRVAFIVPPSRSRILRGYYCTTTSKGRYYWPLIDHWVQGAYLQSQADVRLFDGVLLSEAELMTQLRKFAPELAVISIGGFSEPDDRRFAESLARTLSIPWIATGEAVLFPRSIWRESPWLLGLLTNFAGEGLSRFLREGTAGEGFLPLKAQIEVTHERPKFLSWGTPPNWSLRGYRFPMLGRPVASVMTTFGCPFTCNYCSNNRNILGLRFRDEDDLMAELSAWAERGVHNLFVSDANFGGTAPRAKVLLRRMAAQSFPFRWATFLRPEMIDDELADLLHDAGCVQVQMGVESANRAVLDQVARHGNAQRVDEAFRLLDERGIRRGGHFVLGLPGETEADIRKTIGLAKRLNPDFAAFNSGVVRAGTVYYEEGKQTGDSTIACGELLGTIDGKRLDQFQRMAIWSIHLRPQFVLRLARTLWHDPRLVLDIVSDGAAMLARTVWEAIQSLSSRSMPP